MTTGDSALDDRLHWYKDAIIYELHIKAFFDGNGDGLGDFTGLIEKLDYLRNLGVTAIWLLPFYPSPLRDDGYDIADYYSIKQEYGTIKQFKLFLKEAHKRDLKVITELVINHTSDQHPWFQRARRAPSGSPMRDVYVWTNDPSDFKDARIIFQDFETSNWTWDPLAGQYYWHRFYFHQPDLNFRNPMVKKQVFKIIDFWCAMGVDGFRLDAVPYLFEANGTNSENLPETHTFLKELRAHVDEVFPGTLLLAEANMWPEDSVSYFGDGDECQMNYQFPLMPRMFMALQMEERYPIIEILEQTPAIPDTCQWAIFLRNHDELTLEMVTDEERDYMYKMYAKDPKAKINLGIRHRLAPLMGGNRKKIELLNYLLFSLPGSPVIYYGDEIGMGDNVYLGDRDGVRTPMQWTADRNAGFSSANPQGLYLPLIIDPAYHYTSVNVEMQEQSDSSLLWWMRRVIATRKKHQAFSRGSLSFLSSSNSKILSFARCYGDEEILVLANLSRYTQAVELDLSSYKGYQPVEIFGKSKYPVITGKEPYLFTLGQYECQWLVLDKLKSLIMEEASPVIVISSWRGLTVSPELNKLQKLLPAYLMRSRWFGGKGKEILGVSIFDSATVSVSADPFFVLLLEVAYENGKSETYQLPIGLKRGAEAELLTETYPKAIIASVIVSNEEGYLYDASYGNEFQQAIFYFMARNHEMSQGVGSLSFSSVKELKNYVRDREVVKSKVLSVEQSNTAIVYDSAYFLKLYRKVEHEINPDVEVTKFLTEQAGFEAIPAYVGAIEWKTPKGNMVLGMMQNFVEASGDGWTYMLDRLDHYNQIILLSAGREVPAKLGSITRPLSYEELPEDVKNDFDASAAERARLLGVRTGEMHIGLALGDVKSDFGKEDFSLHYQRSLFSSLLSTLRTTLDGALEAVSRRSEEVQEEAARIVSLREAIVLKFKRIYDHKLDAIKIRTHGDYHLGQVLFTARDLVILDFEGEPARSYSERRIRQSPLKDVTGMIRSFHYAAYGSLILDSQIRKEDREKLEPFVEAWYHYMSGFFMKAYLETVAGRGFIPADSKDLALMLETYLLQKALYEFNYEVNNRPEWLVIPIKGILSMFTEQEAEKLKIIE